MTYETTLAIPEVCNCCGSKNVIFTTNNKLYGKNHGDWPYIYFCQDCRASVGCHQSTNKPLGILANAKTRRLRREAHLEFDKLWRKGWLTREDAYNKLADFLGIEHDKCHLSWLADDQLKLTARWSECYMKENPPIIRRQAKKNAKQSERLGRESKQRNRRKTNRKSRFSRSNEEH